MMLNRIYIVWVLINLPVCSTVESISLMVYVCVILHSKRCEEVMSCTCLNPFNFSIAVICP